MNQDPPTLVAKMSYDIELLQVTKMFGSASAVSNLTVRVQRGTFFSLLGPSGCGKTTTLRLIAGFEQPTSGRILIAGTDVAGLPPYQRDVNTVFQHYALFPHMSVADNIAYGLRQRGLNRKEVQHRVTEALQMVRLPDAHKRRPSQLSGGQQQRIALARALVNRPTVLLLDEPLSALDLKLRKEMQAELKVLQQTVGITFVYVTHDQDEAITLSDRMAVMNAGRLEQEGTPEEIYERPITRFVADFIGLSNFIGGEVQECVTDSSGVQGMRRVVVQTPIGPLICTGWQPEVHRGERVTLTLRPEKIRLFPVGAEPGNSWNVVKGLVAQATFLGEQNEYQLRVGSENSASLRELTVRQQNIGALSGGEASDSHDDGMEGQWRVFAPGEQVMIGWQYGASLILRDVESSAQQAGSVPDSTLTPGEIEP